MAKLSIVSFIIQVIVCDYFLNLVSDPVHQVPLTLSDSFHSARSFLLLVDFKKKKNEKIRNICKELEYSFKNATPFHKVYPA